jgi:hypothetical protein
MIFIKLSSLNKSYHIFIHKLFGVETTLVRLVVEPLLNLKQVLR